MPFLPPLTRHLLQLKKGVGRFKYRRNRTKEAGKKKRMSGLALGFDGGERDERRKKRKKKQQQRQKRELDCGTKVLSTSLSQFY